MAAEKAGGRVIVPPLVAVDREARAETAGFTTFASGLMAAACVDPAQLHVCRMRVAGLGIGIASDDRHLIDAYRSRFAQEQDDRQAAAVNIRALGLRTLGLAAMPRWCDPSQPDARAFHTPGRTGFDACFSDDPPVWTLFDRTASTALQLATRASALPPWEIGAPCRLPIHYALRREGRRLAHAGTLGRDGRGVLICGLGGAGKSGTVLAGVMAGLDTVGDDYVALGLEAGVPTARAVYNHAKQDASGLDRLGIRDRLPVEAAPNWQGKYEIPFGALAPGRLVGRLGIRALVVPERVGDGQTGIAPCGAALAMKALGLSSMTQLPENMRTGFSDFARLLRPLPAFRLRIGPDPEKVTAAVSGLLDRFA